MYYRITLVHRENIAVVALSVYVAFTFTFMEIFYFGVWCRPFHNYWAVPTPNPQQCSAAIHHLIMNAVFNISSDLLTLAVALQLFIRSKLPTRRKLVLCGIFGLGMFVILAAVLNKYYSFRYPFGSQWTFWYIRESSTAILVANLPFMWTLLRRIFKLGSFENPNSGSNNSWDGSPHRDPHHGSWQSADTNQHRTWWKRMMERGRRFSSNVLHGVDPGSNPRTFGSSRSHNISNGSEGVHNWKRPWKARKGTAYRENSSDAYSQELMQSPSSSLHKTNDPEAQRQPWDEMNLGEFLSEGSALDNLSPRQGPSRRKSWGGSL
jgi:hypothetical protein